MKKLLFLLIPLISFGVSYSQEQKNLSLSESEVFWTGYKIGGTHEGNIDFLRGHLIFEGENITGGEFVIDMNTLTATDLKGKSKEKLENHLKSDDYFDVETYPTAMLTIISATKKEDGLYDVESTLTIKDVSQKFMFSLRVNDKEASADVSINRKDFNVTAGGLKDKAIKDIFTLQVRLKLD